ncbi:MAG: hypothetical protein KDA58_04965, partial [Planctomycetaceae bacterium]|nr:hypothetical protein [Planctomycetaceae bacterium]
VPVPRTEPFRVEPLYNRPDLVSDEDLATVLWRIQPRFDRRQMKPNHVEHALRTWSVRAKFQNPNAISGQEMAKFLTDTASFTDSWGIEVEPLLQDTGNGVSIRYGTAQGASVHHDHWLACLTEAGANIDTPVFTPGRRNWTLRDVLQQSLRDFRLDERETEWTAMAFGLWIAPTREWTGAAGRKYSFDLLVDRLIRGQKELGVCVGTHRVYSLMLLVRLDDEFDILSDAGRGRAWAYLEDVRDLITVAQFPDGHWPANWPDGTAAVESPREDDFYKLVIATGHHIEWLSIAPPELHPPEEQIQLAMQWLVKTTSEQTKADILQRYTFFSHVGAALANWRQEHPADFWRRWEAEHPFDAEAEATFDATGATSESTAAEAAAH